MGNVMTYSGITVKIRAMQAKLLKEYAQKNGIIISKIFYELGISGRKD